MVRAETLRRPAFLIVEGGVLLALLILWCTAPKEPPRVRWSVGEAAAPSEPFGRVALHTPLRLTIELPRAMHVYVASWDPVRGPVALFPSSALRAEITANPLPPGRHVLPGHRGDQRLDWHAGDGSGPCSFLVVASDAPLPDLEARLSRFRQMGNAAFPDQQVLGTYAPDGGMEVVPAFTELPDGLLGAALALQDPSADGPMLPARGARDVWLKVLRLTTERTPIADEDALRSAVRARLGGVEVPLPEPPKAR